MSTVPAGRRDHGRGALVGLRVIDLTQMLAGPFAAQLLADHGADVVKVEARAGDMTRSYGPYAADDAERDMGGYYQSVNRNKRGVVLDLKSDEGRGLLMQMIDGADVLVENFRTGVMDRLGLSYEILSARNPRLVYACIRGFGDPRSGESPYVHWPAFDVVSQAMGGMMGVTGEPDGPPMKVGPGVGDLFPAALCAFGILAAVMHARATGQGQFVDVSMVDGVLACSERVVYQYSLNGVAPKAQGSSHPLVGPFGVFPAKNGWVTVACPTEEFWRKLCELMKRPELATDERFCTNERRMRNLAAVNAIVAEFVGRHTKAELNVVFGGQIPYGPVYDAGDIFADPHFRARGMLVEIDQPGCARPMTVAGVPVKMSRTPGSVRSRAPQLGEHTREVLAELGVAPDRIEALHASGAVHCKS